MACLNGNCSKTWSVRSERCPKRLNHIASLERHGSPAWAGSKVAESDPADYAMRTVPSPAFLAVALNDLNSFRLTAANAAS